MAPDAVVGLVEAAGEIGARIGQRETLATPSVVLRKLPHVDAVSCFMLDRHQPHVVELTRSFE